MRRFIYPQYVFSKEIKRLLKTRKVNYPRSIIDCPCGSGITTYNLAKWFPKDKFYGVDLDLEAINSAQSSFKFPNLQFEHNDIFDFLETAQKVDVICLINSLFLFENPQKLLEKLKEKIVHGGKMFVIIPNIEGKNFNIFQEKYPEVNKFTIKNLEIDAFFEHLDFQVHSVTPICFVHHFGRIEAKFLRFLFNPYLILIEKLNKFFKIQSANYFLVELGC